MDKISIGIPVYGPQPANWWAPLVSMTANLHKQDIDLTGLLTATSMATDINRNSIVEEFLNTTNDWLVWIDGDNPMPTHGIRRLLDTAKDGKTIVSGIYYQKAEPYIPVVFRRLPNNRYTELNEWNHGEIIEIDMAGMGCCVTHRSVFEDMREQFVPMQRWAGGIVPVHRDDIKGSIPESSGVARPRFRDGQWHETYSRPEPHAIRFWPWFYLEYGKTEDVTFYENAQRAGHFAYCDTSVESPHIGTWKVDGQVYRKAKAERLGSQNRITEYVSIDSQGEAYEQESA
jgi:hypothetical protein